MYVSVILIRIIIFALALPAQEGAGNHDAQAPEGSTAWIKVALDEVAEYSKEIGNVDGNPGLKKFVTLSADKLVPPVVEALRSDPRFRAPAVRLTAYTILIAHPAHGWGTTVQGREQLLRGLEEHDYPIKVTCLTGLSTLGPESYEEIATALAKVWQGIDLNAIPPPTHGDRMPEEGDLVIGLLQMSAHLGSAGKAFLGQAERIFRDEKLDKSLRSAAAGALIGIAGIKDAWDHFHETDPLGETFVLWRLVDYAVRERVAGKLDEPAAERIRARIVAGLKHTSGEVRHMALRSLDGGFGDKLLIIRSRTDFDVNPQVKPIVEEMSVKDPDPNVRETAARLLDPTALREIVDRRLGKPIP